MQPEYARLANRVVKIAELAEAFNISLADGGASEITELLAQVPDAELDKIGEGSDPVIGCPARIIPLFAGYSKHCDTCPYFHCDGAGKRDCVIKDE